MLNTHLKYPPIRNKAVKELPKALIYHQLKTPQDRFILFPTNKSEFGRIVIMECAKEFITRKDIGYTESLCIDKLISTCRGKGYGTAMLDFAKIYSKKTGCNGFFHLFADGCYNPHRLPHIFYRKYGMSTLNPKIDKKLDKLIVKKQNATYKDFDTEKMYYPPIKHPESKLKQIIKKIFKHFK